jgi:uncharacterized membrane protein YkoI
MNRFGRLSILAFGAVVLAGSAYAAESAMSNDASQILRARVSLPRAISIAEQQTNGKASSAELEQDKNGLTYHVETVSQSNVMDVVVDATTGKVIKASVDRNDHDTEKEVDD